MSDEAAMRRTEVAAFFGIHPLNRPTRKMIEAYERYHSADPVEKERGRRECQEIMRSGCLVRAPDDVKLFRDAPTPTLRDQFAMASMQGQMIGNTQTPEFVADTAYRFADAMMERRGK